MAAYGCALTLEPGDFGTLRDAGDLAQITGSTEKAGALYGRALAMARNQADKPGSTSTDRRNVAVASNWIGDVQQAQGDLTAALASYRQALAISERLAKADPTNAQWQKDLVHTRREVSELEAAIGK